MIFLHLGAGAGDQDSRAKYRCGFTEFIKKNYKKNDLVYLVEANTKNISKLRLLSNPSGISSINIYKIILNLIISLISRILLLYK